MNLLKILITPHLTAHKFKCLLPADREILIEELINKIIVVELFILSTYSNSIANLTLNYTKNEKMTCNMKTHNKDPSCEIDGSQVCVKQIFCVNDLRLLSRHVTAFHIS